MSYLGHTYTKKKVFTVYLICGYSYVPSVLSGQPTLILKSSVPREEGQGHCTFPNPLYPTDKKCFAISLRSNSFSFLPGPGLLVEGKRWM